jgi:hypothetical protein
VKRRRGTIAVAGAIAQRPGRGGHAWVFLQYLIGLRRLGWDVLFIDRLQPGTCSDAAYVDRIMRQFGFGGDYSVLDSGGGAFGLTRAQVAQRLKGCALLLNFMGYLDDAELLALPNRSVFFDIDPGFTQMWQALGLAEMLAGHDVFVTVGENVGSPDCAIPTCDVRWITTPPPVVLDQWPWAAGEATSITGIGSWRGPYGTVSYGGVEYGLRVHEFRKFAALPARLGATAFEYALDIEPIEARDSELLTSGGWRLLDPVCVAGTPDAYRDFVQRSIAEFMVAKSIYVRSRSGWFSDRSACYLASGRPVIAQDTGRTDGYSAGLLTFTTADEAVGAVREVVGDYARHRRAAREIAEEVFDSDRVLSRLVDTVLAA